MKRIYFGLFFLLLTLLIIFLVKLFLDSATTKVQTFSKQQESDYWDLRIKEVGGQQAYLEFKDKYLTQYPSGVHYLTHIFGEALYKNEGNEGIAVCDNNFAYGCFHGVIISALEDKGLGIIPELNNVCVSKDGPNETGCRHGIGHGLVEYLGREPQQIKQALEICSSIQTPMPLGCTQGVFMEYNKPGMADSDTEFIGVRRLDSEDNLYKPCPSLAEKFQVSCYYEQSQWWIVVLNYDYSRIGSMCQNLASEKLQQACFMGIGSVIAQRSGYNAQATIAICDQMPQVADRVYCRATAGWIFKINPKFKNQASELCNGLPEADRQNCLEKSISPERVI